MSLIAEKLCDSFINLTFKKRYLHYFYCGRPFMLSENSRHSTKAVLKKAAFITKIRYLCTRAANQQFHPDLMKKVE